MIKYHSELCDAAKRGPDDLTQIVFRADTETVLHKLLICDRCLSFMRMQIPITDRSAES